MDDASASIVFARTFSGEAVMPNPVPCTAAISRISWVGPAVAWPAMYFAIAVDSPKLSLRSRSLRDTSMPAPVTPMCRLSHSSAVKSAFDAIDLLHSWAVRPAHVVQPPAPLATPAVEAASCSACSASRAIGLRSNTTFRSVPVKAYGALSS